MSETMIQVGQKKSFPVRWRLGLSEDDDSVWAEREVLVVDDEKGGEACMLTRRVTSFGKAPALALRLLADQIEELDKGALIAKEGVMSDEPRLSDPTDLGYLFIHGPIEAYEKAQKIAEEEYRSRKTPATGTLTLDCFNTVFKEFSLTKRGEVHGFVVGARKLRSFLNWCGDNCPHLSQRFNEGLRTAYLRPVIVTDDDPDIFFGFTEGEYQEVLKNVTEAEWPPDSK